TRYYQVLNALVDRPEALASDPMLVKRLRSKLGDRHRVRTVWGRGYMWTSDRASVGRPDADD
ncbi:MAG: DUF3263 domain-containing protein, partial [Mycobacterium sp.]